MADDTPKLQMSAMSIALTLATDDLGEIDAEGILIEITNAHLVLSVPHQPHLSYGLTPSMDAVISSEFINTIDVSGAIHKSFARAIEQLRTRILQSLQDTSPPEAGSIKPHLPTIGLGLKR